jgi:hypothetical protein
MDDILVECDTVDEVRKLVGALQLPFGEDKPAYVSAEPVNNQIVLKDRPAEDRPAEEPVKKKRRGHRPSPLFIAASKQRDCVIAATKRRDLIANFLQGNPRPVHRREIIEHVKLLGGGPIENAMLRLIREGKVRHTGTHGFYEYVPVLSENGNGNGNLGEHDDESLCPDYH